MGKIASTWWEMAGTTSGKRVQGKCCFHSVQEPCRNPAPKEHCRLRGNSLGVSLDDRCTNDCEQFIFQTYSYSAKIRAVATPPLPFRYFDLICQVLTTGELFVSFDETNHRWGKPYFSSARQPPSTESNGTVSLVQKHLRTHLSIAIAGSSSLQRHCQRV